MLSDNEEDPVVLWAEICRLQEEAKGPAGFATWKDAAIAERLSRMRLPSSLKTEITKQLVDDFAGALGQQLALKEQQHGYTDEWAKSDWMDECRAKVREHVEKGNPLDVAGYCAFLWWHGESTNAK